MVKFLRLYRHERHREIVFTAVVIDFQYEKKMTIPPSILPRSFSVTTVAEISCDKFISNAQRYKKLKDYVGAKESAAF